MIKPTSFATIVALFLYAPAHGMDYTTRVTELTEQKDEERKKREEKQREEKRKERRETFDEALATFHPHPYFSGCNSSSNGCRYSRYRTDSYRTDIGCYDICPNCDRREIAIQESVNIFTRSLPYITESQLAQSRDRSGDHSLPHTLVEQICANPLARNYRREYVDLLAAIVNKFNIARLSQRSSYSLSDGYHTTRFIDLTPIQPHVALHPEALSFP